MQEEVIRKKKLSISDLLQWIFPLLLIVLIEIAKLFPAFIEQYYATGIYISISNFLRNITSFTTVSIGDILYAVVFIQLIIGVFKIISAIIRKRLSWLFFLNSVKKLILKLLWIYIVFNLLWALNYYRLGIAYQLKIHKTEYTKNDVEALVCDLVQKLNSIRKQIGNDSLPQPRFKETYKHTAALYDSASKQFPFLKQKHLTVKTSLFSSISHYVGFTGYYNPFSGEAQLSTDIPKILSPYVTCHETAHQLGYASEDEANFAGYLVCSSSNDLYYQYSVYMDIYKYAAMELFMTDFETTHAWELDSLVRKDFRDVRKFFARKSNKVSPVMGQLYEQYLKANQQSRGLQSYNDVIGLLIAYKKKGNKI